MPSCCGDSASAAWLPARRAPLKLLGAVAGRRRLLADLAPGPADDSLSAWFQRCRRSRAVRPALAVAGTTTRRRPSATGSRWRTAGVFVLAAPVRTAGLWRATGPPDRSESCRRSTTRWLFTGPARRVAGRSGPGKEQEAEQEVRGHYFHSRHFDAAWLGWSASSSTGPAGCGAGSSLNGVVYLTRTLRLVTPARSADGRAAPSSAMGGQHHRRSGGRRPG